MWVLGSPRNCDTQIILRVAHRSRLLRRVGSNAPRPRSLFSGLGFSRFCRDRRPRWTANTSAYHLSNSAHLVATLGVREFSILYFRMSPFCALLSRPKRRISADLQWRIMATTLRQEILRPRSPRPSSPRLTLLLHSPSQSFGRSPGGPHARICRKGNIRFSLRRSSRCRHAPEMAR
jgi:hypothetical protein